MGRIKFVKFYTRVVEHYLRMTVRNSYVLGEVSQKWFKLTTNWINKLSDEDRDLIQFVFSKDYNDIYEGIGCYPGWEAYPVKLERLFKLERDFAITSGFIGEETYYDGGAES